MNEDSIHDASLQAFEARLAASTPRISARRKDELLYACAYAAGARAGRPSLRRWRRATGLLCGVLLGVAVAHFPRSSTKEQSRIAMQPPEAPVNQESQPMPASRPTEIQNEFLKPFSIRLDAWQLPSSSVDSLSIQLVQLGQLDPDQRSLTVGRFGLTTF